MFAGVVVNERIGVRSSAEQAAQLCEKLCAHMGCTAEGLSAVATYTHKLATVCSQSAVPSTIMIGASWRRTSACSRWMPSSATTWTTSLAANAGISGKGIASNQHCIRIDKETGKPLGASITPFPLDAMFGRSPTVFALRRAVTKHQHRRNSRAAAWAGRRFVA